MSNASSTEQEFLDLIIKHGPSQTAKILGITERAVYLRRASLESRLGVPIAVRNSKIERLPNTRHPERVEFNIDSGVVLIGSDAHYWPGIVTTAHRAFVKACGMLKPKMVVMNGDAFDGSSISRHPPIGWESSPSVEQELQACQERLQEILDASVNAEHVWTLGNHDSRFETKLASVASEFAGVKGMHLQDHFPEWRPAWSMRLNSSVVIKHRYRGGVHAAYANALHSGMTIVTGHTHSLKVTPVSNYNGTHWGVETGTLAEAFGPQFRDYTEDNPRNHISGFAALTFENGRLAPPETVMVTGDDEVAFRGKFWRV